MIFRLIMKIQKGGNRHHMKHLSKPTASVALLLLMFIGIAPVAYAAGTDAVVSTKAAFNMAIAYGITSAAALLLAAGYWSLVKKKNTWLQLLFVSVVIVNCGYFALAISKTLPEALLANRVSYLGSVFLPLCMLMTIMDVCRVNYTKKIPDRFGRGFFHYQEFTSSSVYPSAVKAWNLLPHQY